MADLSSTQSTVLAVAAVVAAVGIIWRGVFRPLTRFGGWVQDIASDWRTTVELVRDLVPLVAQLLVTTERRLSRLEARVGVTPDADDGVSSLLAQQLSAQMMRDPKTRTRESDRGGHRDG